MTKNILEGKRLKGLELIYNGWTIKNLKDYCRENKIKGFSKLKKLELMKVIENHRKSIGYYKKREKTNLQSDIFGSIWNIKYDERQIEKGKKNLIKYNKKYGKKYGKKTEIYDRDRYLFNPETREKKLIKYKIKFIKIIEDYKKKYGNEDYNNLMNNVPQYMKNYSKYVKIIEKEIKI